MKLIGIGSGKEEGSERAQWVRRYRESGLGLKRFAQRHGLRATQLHYWTYQSAAGAASERKGAPIFQEVALPADWSKNPRWAAEIGFPDGLVVRLSSGAEVAWASALVESLRRPCSH